MNHMETIHLRPTAELAERVLLPGDPGRALALAQLLLEKPLMFNHHRGLWGYTGEAMDGALLTVQSTGMGGPSAAIVLHELIALGVKRAIRVGTCGALHPTLRLGDLVVAREAIAADGTSAALLAGAAADRTSAALIAGATAGCAPASAVVETTTLAEHEPEERSRAHAGARTRGSTYARTYPHRALTDRLEDALAGHRGRAHGNATIVSTDLFYEPGQGRIGKWSAEEAIAVEMEASALFAVGERAAIEVGCLLTVSDTFDGNGNRSRIDEHALLEAAETMGRAAATALAE
ncbi:MAG TPA: hypothetical protein VIG42_08105 [Solirubrobacteraceae bacterium]|jgi:uridine phosphorylase